MYKKTVHYFFLLLSLLGCADKDTDKNEIDFRFSKLSEQSTSNNVKNYFVVPLETRDDTYITRIRKILVNENRIFLLEGTDSRQQILIFSFDGKFITSIYEQGRGAREYQYLGDFDICPNSNLISVLDPGLHKIFTYNMNSEYQYEFRFDCSAKEFKYFKEGKNIYKTFTVKESNLTDDIGYDIYVYNEENKLLYSSLPFSVAISLGMGNGIHLTRNNNKIRYFRPNTNLIYSITKDSAQINYVLRFPYEVLPGNELENVFFKGKDILHKYVYNIIYFEASGTIYTLFMYNKEVYWGLFNKDTGESVLFQEQKDPSCNCGITLNFIGTYKKYFILETEYSKINSVLNVLDPDRIKCSDPGIFETIEKLDMTSNPVLIFVEFSI